MKSIIPGNHRDQCFICKRYCRTEEHHIFGGQKNRDAAERCGLKVNLCYEHHRGTWGAHGMNGKKLQEYLHTVGQEAYEERKMKYENLSLLQARDEFRKEFSKSYL